MIDIERGRDTGGVRSRLHAGSPTQDSIPDSRIAPWAKGRRQTLSHPGIPRADFELEWNWTKIEVRNNARVTWLTDPINDGSVVLTEKTCLPTGMKEKDGPVSDRTTIRKGNKKNQFSLYKPSLEAFVG